MKIAKSLFMIMAMAVLAIGATSAYFTDQETVAGNTFSTGNIDIDIRGAGSSSQTFTGMAPGVWSSPIEYQIYNKAGSLPVKYRFYDRRVSESAPGLYGRINVRVRHTHAGTPNPSGWPIVYNGKLKDLLVDSTATSGIISATLGTNITHVFYLEYQLDAGAPDSLQSQTAVFDLVFDATQPGNPGWSQQ